MFYCLTHQYLHSGQTHRFCLLQECGMAQSNMAADVHNKIFRNETLRYTISSESSLEDFFEKKGFKLT